MVKSIVGMVQDYQTQIAPNEYIPLLIDYSCSFGECTGAFQSFNNLMSNVVPEIVTALKGDWLASYIKDHNDILVLNNEMKFGFKKFRSGLKIKGIICSRNYNPTFEEKRVLEIDCDTVMNGNIDFSDALYTTWTVKCPASCAKEGAKPVVGNMIYKDDSSICLAAVEQGIYKD